MIDMVQKKPSQPLPPLIIILVGLPSSGKSTLAKYLGMKISHLYPKYTIIDTDEIRKNLFGPNFDPSQETIVIQKKLALIQKQISNDHALIVDDMHYYVSMRHEIYTLVRNQHGLFIAIYCDTPLEICLQWNHLRSNSVPEKVIRDVAEKFNFPGKKYRWDKPFFTVHIEKNTMKDDIDRIFDKLTKLVLNSIPNRIQEVSNSDTTASLDTIIDHGIRDLFHHIIIQDLTENQFIQLQQWKKKIPFSIESKAQCAKYLAKIKPQFQHWLMENFNSKSDFGEITLARFFSLFISFSDR